VLSLVSWPLDLKENAFRFHLVSVEMKVSSSGVQGRFYRAFCD
jgi:hypothetical protein